MTNDELIARLEAATGPDRELDAAIACFTKFKNLRPSRPDDFGGKYGYHPGDIKTEYGFIQAARYTASIDAALTLVKNRAPKAIFDVLRTAALWWTQAGSTDISDLPRFIVIAALRAQQEGEGA